MEIIEPKDIGQQQEAVKTPGTPPAFKGDGVSVWLNKDKNGKQYLSIQLLGKGGFKVLAFQYTPKEKEGK